MINPDTARTFIDLYERAGDDITGAAHALDNLGATNEGQAK